MLVIFEKQPKATLKFLLDSFIVTEKYIQQNNKKFQIY